MKFCPFAGQKSRSDASPLHFCPHIGQKFLGDLSPSDFCPHRRPVGLTSRRTGDERHHL